MEEQGSRKRIRRVPFNLFLEKKKTKRCTEDPCSVTSSGFYCHVTTKHKRFSDIVQLPHFQSVCMPLMPGKASLARFVEFSEALQVYSRED